MGVTVVLVVHNQVALTRACLDSVRRAARDFELCVVDNGSSDGTEAYLRDLDWPSAIRYRRNDQNVGLIRALNQGARLARGEFLCFLHNDTEMRDPRWLERLHSAVADAGGTGLAGLCGARRLRRDGRYVARGLVHCIEGRANLRAPTVEVAAVDGVCLFLGRSTLESAGGFDEGYGFFHGYDRDLSFAVREAGGRCLVVNAPFAHQGGGTRTGESAPVRPAEDLAQRRAARERFARKWRHRLPSDVRAVKERVSDWFGARRVAL